jgi:hypothetical protein
MYSRLYAEYDSLSGNTMAIHPVMECGLLGSSHVCCLLIRLVVVSLDNTIHLVLLEM